MLSDTTGESTVEKIKSLYPILKNNFPTTSLGLHLHSKVDDTDAKLQTALDLGCTRFDTALRGFGGCPMAKDDLVGNIATESLLSLLKKNHLPDRLNKEAWDEAFEYSWRIFKS
jgi:hydroxymethylglutaryl-CoA lyase